MRADYFDKIYFYLVLLLALMLPYLGLLSVWDKTNILSVLLKEILVIIIIGLSFLSLKKVPNILNLTQRLASNSSDSDRPAKTDSLLLSEVTTSLPSNKISFSLSKSNPREYNLSLSLAYILLGLIIGTVLVSLYLKQDLISIMLGLKYDFAPLLLLIMIKIRSRISQKEIRLLIRFLTYNALFLSLLSIVQQILPSWWESIGFNSGNVNPYQLVDPALDLVRSFVFSAGPNQFGLYLTIILGVNLYYPDIIQTKSINRIIISAILIVAIVMTFSRSALVATIVIIFYRIYVMMRDWLRQCIGSKWLPLAIIGSMVVVLSILLYQNFYLRESKVGYLIHHGRILDQRVEGSDNLRLQALSESIEGIKKAPWLGHGLGSSGPATLHHSKGQINENWFLQIYYELGMPMGLLYFATLYLIWRSILDLDKRAFLAVVLPIMITGLFLHSFADSMIGYSSAIILASLSLLKKQES